MNKIHILLVFAVTLNLFSSCKKTEEDVPVPFFDVNFIVTPNPIGGISDVSFLTEPYLAFNKKVDFEYNSYSPLCKYKIIIDSSWVCNVDEQLVQATKTYSLTKDTIKFKPVDGLVANMSYKIKLQYHIEIKKPDSDKYENLLQDGQPYHASFESSFSTRVYNFSIDTSNVEYAYPWPYQYHFLKNETTRGVLKMKANQESDLYFKNATFKVRFSSLTGQSWLNDATYNLSERKYIFTIPSDNLENQKIYKIEYIMVNNSNKSESVFLTYHFRTSKFNRFEEKINSVYNLSDKQKFIGQGIAYLYKFFSINEPFDKAEGKEFIGLVRFEALADQSNTWMVNFFKFYDGLKTHKNRYNWNGNYYNRNINVEVPPLNAISLEKSDLVSNLTPQQIIDNTALDNTNSSQKIVHFLSYYYVNDWTRTRELIFQYGTNIDEWEAYYRDFRLFGLKYNEYYYFKIKYIAGDQVTYTSSDWSIYYF